VSAGRREARVNQPAEPPAQLLVKWQQVGDDEATVAHLFTLLSGSFLIYAGVTRGGLAFARLLERFVGA
jgi:hypothetical protein